MSSAAETTGARVAGERPPRPRALFTAATAGLAAGYLTYRSLGREAAHD